MKVRAPQKKRIQSPFSRSLFTVVLLSLPVVFIFLSSVLFGGGNDLPNAQVTAVTNKTTGSASMHPPSNGRPVVYYDKVMKQSDDQVHRYAAFVVEGPGAGLLDKKKPLTIRRWAQLMADEDSEYSAVLARNISSILKESPFPAFRFETKGCHEANMGEKQFEFVLVNDVFLSTFAASADASAFAEHFRDDSSSPAVVFPNLGNDAVLIVPRPLSTTNSEGIYGHCGNFMRGASTSQVADTWRLVALSFLDRVAARHERTIWLSTAGTGVAWLHFRLDDRPKYYEYQPFTTEK